MLQSQILDTFHMILPFPFSIEVSSLHLVLSCHEFPLSSLRKTFQTVQLCLADEGVGLVVESWVLKSNLKSSSCLTFVFL